jgi:hypothetical protein
MKPDAGLKSGAFLSPGTRRFRFVIHRAVAKDARVNQA